MAAVRKVFDSVNYCPAVSSVGLARNILGTDRFHTAMKKNSSLCVQKEGKFDVHDIGFAAVSKVKKHVSHC